MSLLNKLCFILLFGVYCEAQIPTEKEAYMTVPSLIRAAGYPVEKHRVTTSDGYILIMYRIPTGRRSDSRTGAVNAKGKKAIVILHGLGGGSSNFVIKGPKKSLGYFLADAGYDVWLPDLRGTLLSKHMNLTKTDEKFWNFSYHEHGKYDVPAVIDKILNVTGLDKIMCLGHSLGVTNFFTLLTLRPEYNEKLIAFVALGPSVYLGQFKEILHMAINVLEIPKLFKARGYFALMPHMAHYLQANICNLKRPEIDICTAAITSLAGENFEQHESEMLPLYIYRVQPLSFTTLVHSAKVAISGVFTTFSGGLHGPIVPYNMSNVKIPVSLMYGKNDRFSDKAEVLRLEEDLKANGVLEDIEGPVTWDKFNHLDFIFAKDVATLLNKPLVKHFDKMYNKYYGPV